jgi:PAS domain-containing protein
MQILRSPALFGHTVEDGHVLLGDDGMPIAFAPGVIDQETWTRLQERLDARSYQKVRTATDSMLLGIARCDCGSFLYRSDRVKANGREYKYYGERFDASCGARLIPAPVLDKLVTQALLDIVGGHEVLRRETEAGSGHEVELRAVGAQIVPPELGVDVAQRAPPVAARCRGQCHRPARGHAVVDAPCGTAGS